MSLSRATMAKLLRFWHALRQPPSPARRCSTSVASCFSAQELLAVLFAPVILCFSMPSCAQEIVEFVTEHTVEVPGVGSVCSYSVFDFGR